MKKMRLSGKFFSTLFALAISLSTIPLISVTAEAAANTDWNFSDYTDKNKSRKGTGYEWIVNSTGTHTLNISNIDIEESIQVPEDTTIKFSGKNTITCSDGSAISCYGALTILGADSKSTLTIKATGGTANGIDSLDKLKLSGKINITSKNTSIYGNTVTIKDADITAKASNSYALFSSKETTIQSSKIESKSGGINCGSDLKITSSIVNINDTSRSSGISANKLTVSGSKLNISATDSPAISTYASTKFSNSDIKAKSNLSAVTVKNFEMSSGTLEAITTYKNRTAIHYDRNAKFALNKGLTVTGSSDASGSANKKISYKDGEFICGKEKYSIIYAQKVLITDGKKITVDTSDSSASARTLTVNFGKEFEGETVVLYKIEAGNEVKVKSAKLDSNGKAKFNILNNVSYIVKFA